MKTHNKGYLKTAVKKPLIGEGGASIAAVVILLAILTILGVIFVSLFSTVFEESTIEATSNMALYIAEGGIEAAMGHLKKTPVSSNWTWNDGYKNKALGSGTVDVEVLQYDNYPNQTTASPYCIVFTSTLLNTGANPARTIFATLSWDPAVNTNNLGLELFSGDLIALGTCATAAGPVASSLTSSEPETVRYRIPEPGSFPSNVTYTVRVSGNTAAPLTHNLAISHPDQPGFNLSNNTRTLIALGKARDSRREVFAAFRRQP